MRHCTISIAASALWALLVTCQPAAAFHYGLGTTDQMIYAPALVAEGRAMWTAGHSLDCRVQFFDDTDALFRAVQSGYARNDPKSPHFGACEVGELARQRVLGLDVVPVARVAVTADGPCLVARAPRAAIGDLRDARVACDATRSDLQFLTAQLATAGLTLDDVRLVDVTWVEGAGSATAAPFLQGQVDAIVINAAGAEACRKADGNILATSPADSIAGSYVLFTKGWMHRDEPGLVRQFVTGYAAGQEYSRAHPDDVAEWVNERHHWLRYRHDMPPVSVDYVGQRMNGHGLMASIELSAEFDEQFRGLEAFFDAHVQAVHDGDRTIEGSGATLAAPTGSAFEDAVAWWRFAGPGDYRNYGTAGRALDLHARGAETNRALYGISTRDYFRPIHLWAHGGFLNDSYGWASDGVRKYAVLGQDAVGELDFSGSFSLWLRSVHRNRSDTVLLGSGSIDGPSGFSVQYLRGERPSIWLAVHGTEHQLTLAELPPQVCLDVCFAYDADAGRLAGWARETKSGTLVAEGVLDQVPAGTIRAAAAPLTLGGHAHRDTDRPLNGNIEAAAIWSRPLAADEVVRLTQGPPRTQVSAGGILSDHVHNVRNYGAVGDGRHDDTDAIQAAIDACVLPISVLDQKSNRWWFEPDNPPRPGHFGGGIVYLPHGVYRTTRPLVLHQGITVRGDEGVRPVIDSEADAGIVFWSGPWRDRDIDFKVRRGIYNVCTDVTLENLWVKAKRFGGHTMGVHVDALRMRGCRWEGGEAGFANTGFMMFSQIKDCQFTSLWILTRDGSRFNTSIIENISIGLHGTRREDWALRLEGCIQCVRLSEITFEARARGIYLDSYAAGVTIDIENVWNYDTGGSAEVLRIVNGRGITVRNMMALDHPSTIFIGSNVRHIKMENILAASITVEDAAATRPIFSNVPTIKHGDQESMIEGEGGRPKE